MNALTVAQYSKKKKKNPPQEDLLVEADLQVHLVVALLVHPVAVLLDLRAALLLAKVHLQAHLGNPLQSVAVHLAAVHQRAAVLQSVAVHQPVDPVALQRRAVHLAAVHQRAAVLQSVAVHLADLNAAHLSELTEFSSTKPGFFQTS
jgi:hypothetical protein